MPESHPHTQEIAMAEPGKDRDPPRPTPGRPPTIRRGRLATRRPLRRRDAPARQPIPPAHGQARPNVLSMEYELVLDGREFPARSTTACYASRRPRASKPTRSSAPSWWSTARRPRPRHRRLQAGKRDRRGAARRACLLLRHLPAPAHADPNGRGRDPGRGALPGRDHRPPSRRGRQARGGGHCQAGWQIMMTAAVRPSCSAPSSWPARRCPTGRAGAA